MRGGWAEIKSLGDYALFVGDNASISIQASKFPRVEAIIVYITPMIVGIRTYILISVEKVTTWVFTTWKLEAGQLSTEASLLVLFVLII